jgi:hypothetical protein
MSCRARPKSLPAPPGGTRPSRSIRPPQQGHWSGASARDRMPRSSRLTVHALSHAPANAQTPQPPTLPPERVRSMAEIGPGDVMDGTRLDRLARSTRDLFNTLAGITGRKPGFDPSPTRGPTRRRRAFDADRARRAGGVRERIDPRPHRPRPGAAKARGQNLGRPFKLTPHRDGRVKPCAPLAR